MNFAQRMVHNAYAIYQLRMAHQQDALIMQARCRAMKRGATPAMIEKAILVLAARASAAGAPGYAE